VCIFSIIDPLFEMATATAILAPVADIGRLQEFQTDFGLITVTVLGALGTYYGASSFVTGRNRAF
jgi:hypothetical protein